MMLGPATERSAPESSSAVSSADPLGVEKWAWMVGAGLMLGSREVEVLIDRGKMQTAFVDASVPGFGGVLTSLRDLQTFAKCLVRWHVWHTMRYAGHCLRPPGWKPEPHPGQVC